MGSEIINCLHYVLNMTQWNRFSQRWRNPGRQRDTRQAGSNRKQMNGYLESKCQVFRSHKLLTFRISDTGVILNFFLLWSEPSVSAHWTYVTEIGLKLIFCGLISHDIVLWCKMNIKFNVTCSLQIWCISLKITINVTLELIPILDQEL